MPLPFLVVHGAGAWKLGLFAFVVIVLAMISIVRRLRARHRARSATRELDRERGEGVIRGTLGGGAVATLTVKPHTGQPQVVLDRDPELWIETPEGRIALVGELRAVSGSRVTTAHRRAPKRTPSHVLDQCRASDGKPHAIDVATLCELAPGDRVVARGVLVREASREPTGYRASASVSSLHAGDDVPIAIAARAPQGSAPRMSWPALVALSGALTFAGYEIEAGLGAGWRARCFSDPMSHDQPDDAVLSNTHACVLANTMPNQPQTLDHLADRLDRTPIVGDADADQRLELARFVEGCKGSLRRLRAQPQPELLRAEAVRCGDRETQQLALIKLGKFEAAAKLGPLHERGAGSLLVLAGHWPEAAVLAATHASEAQAATNLNPESKSAIVLHWTCVAELMRWYAGDRAALGRVRALAPGPDSACRVEQVEMTTGAEQDQLLLRGAGAEARSRAYESVSPDEWRVFMLERALAGEPEPLSESVATVLARGASEQLASWQPGLWATTIAPAPTGEPSTAQLAYYTARVVSDVYDGDLAAAHRDVDRALALAGALERERVYFGRELAILHALVDLHGSSTDTAFDNRFAEDHETLSGELQRYLMPGIYLRHGMQVDRSALFHTNVAALEAAAHGDGSSLATQLTMPYHSWSVVEVLAVLPRITTARAAIVSGLRWGPNGDDAIGYGFPWTTIAYAAEHRALFELAGDHAEASGWATIYARYRAAIADRRVLLALALWDRE